MQSLHVERAKKLYPGDRLEGEDLCVKKDSRKGNLRLVPEETLKTWKA